MPTLPLIIVAVLESQQPDLFAEATLIEGEGWAVVWPSADIQIGADTLWLDAQASSNSRKPGPCGCTPEMRTSRVSSAGS